MWELEGQEDDTGVCEVEDTCQFIHWHRKVRPKQTDPITNKVDNKIPIIKLRLSQQTGAQLITQQPPNPTHTLHPLPVPNPPNILPVIKNNKILNRIINLTLNNITDSKPTKNTHW